ncbi:MAG TPA: hypothetical protein VI653_29755, partial [Steroidobacteraceae bacterium]
MNLIQQRILQTLEQQGSVPVSELGRWLTDIDHVDLDVNVSALMREQRVTKSLGRYEIGPVRGTTPPAIRRVANAIADRSTAPPSRAAEEAAASPKPVPRVCDRCKSEKELNEENFSRNRHGFLKICKVCYGAAVAAGGRAKRGQVVEGGPTVVT